MMPDCLHGLLPAPFLLSYSVFLIFRFCAVRWTKLAISSALSARKYIVLYCMSFDSHIRFPISLLLQLRLYLASLTRYYHLFPKI